MTIMRSRGRGDDLFAQQRAAAALDQVQVRVDLVGAVDGQVEFRRLVERRQRHAEFGAEAGRALGRRHADDLHAGRDLVGQQPDELLGGRAGADAEPHAVLDMVKRRPRGLDLQCLVASIVPDYRLRIGSRRSYHFWRGVAKATCGPAPAAACLGAPCGLSATAPADRASCKQGRTA